MSIHILTSMFPNGFNPEVTKVFQQVITDRKRFAFVASEFEKMQEKTDHYFKFFLDMFADIGITFEETCVVDGRLSVVEVQKVVKEADVVWLSGGGYPGTVSLFSKIWIRQSDWPVPGNYHRDECRFH